MYKHFALLAFLCTISFSTFATTLLPQPVSTDVDGIFSISTDTLLFTDADNIYNFISFDISAGAGLSISADSAIYIYSSQAITLDGSIITNAPEVNFIAPEISVINFSTSTNLGLFTNNISLSGDTTSPANNNYNSIISTGSDALITAGVVGTTIISGNIIISGTVESLIIPATPINTGTLTITPVPLPAALWLMISGLAGFGLIGFRRII